MLRGRDILPSPTPSPHAKGRLGAKAGVSLKFIGKFSTSTSWNWKDFEHILYSLRDMDTINIPILQRGKLKLRQVQ